MPLLSPGDLPDPGIEPTFPALASGLFTTEPHTHTHSYIYLSTFIDRYKKREKIRFKVLKMEVEIKHQKLATLQPNPFYISVVFDVLSVKICFSTNI